MAFDFGQMVEQFMDQMNGGSKDGGRTKDGGGGNDDVVYDAAVVGYGPAGGVMVGHRNIGVKSLLLLRNAICQALTATF